MPSLEDRLTEIRHRMDRGEREVPRKDLEDLVMQMSADEFSDWRPDIMKLVGLFQRKKHRDLMRVIENKLDRGATWSRSDRKKTPRVKEVAIAQTVATDSSLAVEFRNALTDLGERHIFQWSTFYRDCLEKYLVRFLDELKSYSPDDPCDALAGPFADHAQDIFSKGYAYVQGHEYAIQKSINGLSRFLALPLDYYSARWSSVTDHSSAVALRLLVSAAASGIIRGYAAVSFGAKDGGTLLPRFPRSWVHLMAFLTPRHAEQVIDQLESGALSDGLRKTVLPLLDALQKFFRIRLPGYGTGFPQ